MSSFKQDMDAHVQHVVLPLGSGKAMGSMLGPNHVTSGNSSQIGADEIRLKYLKFFKCMVKLKNNHGIIFNT